MIYKFKSTGENFKKEYSDVKNNTVRKVDMSKEKFKNLKKLADNNWYYNEWIRIAWADNSEVFFDRKIRDITFWDDICIITWKEK